MPASFRNPGAAEISAAKAIKPQLRAVGRHVPTPSIAVVQRTKPDWLAFPMGALTFNPAFG